VTAPDLYNWSLIERIRDRLNGPADAQLYDIRQIVEAAQPPAAPVDLPAYADPNFKYNEATGSYHRTREATPNATTIAALQEAEQLRSSAATGDAEIPEGYRKLAPHLPPCRCPKLWRDESGSYWCCTPNEPQQSSGNAAIAESAKDFDAWFRKVSSWGLNYDQLVQASFTTPGNDPGDVVYTSPSGSAMTRHMCSHWINFYGAAQMAWSARGCIAAEPQTPIEPTDAMINAAAREMWNDLHAARGGPWESRGEKEVVVVQFKATARAALKAACSVTRPHEKTGGEA